MDYIKIGSREHKRASAGVMIGSVVNFALMYAPQPLISLYSRQYHVSPATAGLSISLTTMTLSVCLFFISIFAASWNRKNIMSWSLIITSCCAILTAVLPGFYLFLALRLFQGIAAAGFPSIAMTYLNEEFSPKDIGRVIGYYVSGTAIGGLIGRILTGLLTDILNWHMAFLIEGILSLLLSIWFLLYLPDSNNFNKINVSFRQVSSVLKNTLFNSKLACMYLTGFLLMGCYVTILNYIGYPLTNPPYNLSQTVFGFLFVVNIFGVLSSMIFGRLTDRYSRRVIMAIAIAIFFSGALLTMDGNLIVKIMGVAFVVFGFFAGHSVASGWIGFIAPKDQKGAASSYYLLFYYWGSSVLGWGGGIFLRYFGWNGIVSYICILLIAAVLVSVRPFSRELNSQPDHIASR